MRLAPALALIAAVSAPAAAQETTLNLYSSRHYQTDEALYSKFTKVTGIKLNRIEAGEDPLIERLRNEGASSPADVLITVDAGRLWRAEQAGLFQPIESKVLAARLPDHMRTPNNQWFGFSARARIIVYNKAAVKAADVQNYEDLADPKMKGKVCTRSGSHVYNLSLMSALIAHWGEAKAEQWARGMVANFARAPKGGDTDQIRAVAAGECGVAISNSYYYVRLLASDKPEDRKVIESTGIIWPNQKSFGTHMNVSGAGVVRHAKHRDAAIKYLEYLASDEAQSYFAEGNNEWPVVKGAPLNNKALASLGTFKMDTLNISALGKNQPVAQKIFDRVGYK
ncbi:MAG: Fe(3+) ABC transporter substrate-binding protein [Betaproteobacteria bacterium]|jgi:iron(III) transport system substrate-binding protein|nr:Fe(3+) ABC transporter substrate-binding protein [Betaproteobacteria bacterium]MDH5343506.1 Fe(3+) ABC transporter substrate-binding protein [Betaproteobacteria bacterium]